jgi:gliding motility-associated-like protein
VVQQLYPRPAVYLGEDGNLCIGGRLQLDAAAFAKYLWHDGSTSRTFAVTSTGTYHVRVTDNNSCIGSDTLTIHSILPLPERFLPPDTAVCAYGSITLKPIAAFKSYLWSTSARSEAITVGNSGLYWLQVTDNNNCVGKDSINVMSKECSSGLFVPNAFTPNGDGKNDMLKAVLLGDIKYFEFAIYNRWGEVVYKTTDPDKGWDGSYFGKTQDTNVFVWACRYQLSGGATMLEKGTLTLIR